MSGYARKFDENTTMSFKANNKQIFKKFNKIWEKVETLLKIDFETKPVYDDDDDDDDDDEEYIKTKIKICADIMITKNAKRKSNM